MTSAGVSKASSSRLSQADALAMYTDLSIHELGRRAHAEACRLHPEPYRTYVVDRNINYSNWCTAQCLFCNFKAPPQGQVGAEGSPAGYVLSFDQIGRKIQELVDIGGTQILLQGGLAPPDLLSFDWYLELLRFIRGNFPKIHIHAFSPPEIFYFSRVFKMSVRDVLLRLREAGLDTIPGGGAEILVDRVRERISRGKTKTDEYLEVMRQAHLLGMRTTITMMFGHIETIPERIDHLQRVRELQDETGGFTAFICWTFQPAGTALAQQYHMRPADPAAPSSAVASCADPATTRSAVASLPDGEHLVLANAHEYLKTLSIARLFLDNIPNLQASWVTQGPKIGQLALFFGANDMGSVMMEENVVSAAGTTYQLNEAEIRRLITDAGWQPKKRNCYYELLE